ncbi:RICIN domain-containing protein [Pedobacter frigoris]|uniref:F5/8 type C domain-containing protein n=1 Tax=Pedobacter frigoris TaxID=2571272 RepID=A0A4U1CBV6_9SPHI|nr:RICIN domain-containing protein [Pedobacter frigoris]TKC04185.1 hypothetical protein FA047_16410 [Pedobacter frigoris]
MKKNLFKWGAVMVLSITSISCKKPLTALSDEGQSYKIHQKIGVVGPIVTQTRNVNIVYFVPNDLDTIAGYRKRLSDLLLWTQDFYKQEMNRNGYGDKTFGLANDGTGKVKIVTIRGSLPKSSYPYEGGSGAVASEINAYFATHPADKTSDHSLIIMPRYQIDANGTPGGPPFYGTGRWCYALDYEEMDIQNLGKTDAVGNRFSVWFGGMVHELGHGLNLPHNRQKVSENATLGMALMWGGNGTLGKSPTFLTAADAAVLNVNQVFNNNSNTYYGNITSNITKINASYNTGSASIILSGKFTSTGTVNSILYFNDPNVNNEGTGVNRDYNAITWESKKIGTDSFSVVMPISDLQEKADGIPYELKVKLVHTNGTVTEQIYSYTFAGGIPLLNFSTRPELSKTGWSIASFSSEETSGEGTVNGRAINLIDGNGSTYWHSRWTGSAASYPHTIVVDLGSSNSAEGLSLSQRSGASRAIKNFQILTSSDGTSFTAVNSYVAQNISGTQYFAFGSTKTFRYFKIIASSAYDGLQFAALAELGLYTDNTSAIENGAFYKLVSAVNNTSVLDVNSSTPVNGTLVSLWANNNPTSNNQVWKVRKVAGGYYTLKSKSDTTKVLDVTGGGSVNGTQIEVYTSNSSNAQKWTLDDAGGGYYYLSPVCAPGSNLDINGSFTANGTKVQIWTKGTGNSQKFKLVKQ